MITDPSLFVQENPEDHDLSKHHSERATNGFSEFDWWNFHDYLCYVIVGGLQRFVEHRTGHPVWQEVQTDEQWEEILKKMIAGFEAQWKMANHEYESHEEYKELAAVWEEGSQLFIKFFPTLWD